MKSGLLLVDKPGGVTSHDVVGACRRLFSRKDIGHAGTLDPMATGLLVILVGKATKLSDFILNGDKSYETTVRLGVVTDTDDITGEVLSETEELNVTLQSVEKAVQSLTGELELKVPIYSAVKVKGKKLYEKARQGEHFEPPQRKMVFKDVELLGFNGQDIRVRFSCSKGSYVRAWGKALGEALGCGATLSELRRVQSQPYAVESSIPLDELNNRDLEQVENLTSWIPLRQTLPTWPLVKVEGQDEKLLMNGQISRRLERFLELEYSSLTSDQGVKVVSKRSGELISLLSFQPPLKFSIRRVFPNP
jgi:tRNA pseudouridine55 synthase